MTCKCKSCGIEISQEERKELISKFGREVYGLVGEFGQMPDTVMADCLIAVAKDLICSKKFSWPYTIGMLQEMLMVGLRNLWESHEEVEIEGDKEEEKNESNTL